MVPDFLNRKKELLKKRENLLVEIGMDILQNSPLPENHANLPRDLERTDQLIKDQSNQLNMLENSLDLSRKKLEQLKEKEASLLEKERAALDPLHLRLKGIETTDGATTSEYAKAKQKLGETKNKFLLLKQELDQRLKETQKDYRMNQAKLDEARSALDILEETRRKRLRDLAYDFYQQNKKNSFFATKFGKFRLIQLELQELNTKEKPSRGMDRVPNERKQLSWLWAPLIVIVSLLALLFFKSEFDTKEVPFHLLATKMPFQEGETRILFDSQHANDYLRQKALEVIQKAPGLTALDPEKTSQFSKILWSEGPDGNLRFLAIHFNESPGHQEHTFQGDGWNRLKNPWSVEAFFKDQWRWYLLNPNEFLLMTSNLELPKYERESDKTPLQILKTSLEPFGQEHPILADFSEFDLVIDPLDFQLTMSAKDLLPDAVARQSYLAALKQRDVFPEGMNCSFENDRLQISGPAVLLEGWESPEDCLHWLGRDLLVSHGLIPSAPLPVNLFAPIEGDGPQKEPDGENGQKTTILKMNLKNHELIMDDSAQFYEPFSDLFVHPDTRELWLLNPEKNHILIYDPWSGGFFFNRRITLPSGFQPQHMMFDQNANRILFFADNENPRNFGLMELDTGAWLSLETAPDHIEAITCGTWAKDLKHLFLGVTTSGERGKMSHGLLVYNARANTTNLSQLIDFPVGPSGRSGIHSLQMNPSHNQLFGLNILQGTLQYFSVEKGLIGQTNGVFLNQLTALELKANPVFHHDANQMVLSRDQKGLLLTDFSDLSKKKYGDRVFYYDIESSPPVMQSMVQPGLFPKTISRFPLGNHFVLILSGQYQLCLLHLEGHALIQDACLSFTHLIPMRMDPDPFGEVLFILCEEK